MKNIFAILFCIAALAACSQDNNSTKAHIDHLSASQLKNYSIATFAAGCFWHEEALFESIKGV